MHKPYRRVILKLSGEALASSKPEDTIDEQRVDQFAAEIAHVRDSQGTQIAVVVGGGNIWRGARGIAAGMDETDADHMGMLATVINALALKDALVRHGQEPRVMSAIPIPRVCEEWIRARALRHFEKKRILILAAGTGNPHFTTDSAAALRGVEIKADVLMKGTHGTVDAIYSADPKQDATATKFSTLTFKEVLDRNLRVMDLTAVTLCQEHGLPVLVFNAMKPGNIQRAMGGEQIGTLVSAT